MTNKQVSKEQRQNTGQDAARNTGMQNPSSPNPSRSAHGNPQDTRSGRDSGSDRRESQDTSGRDRSNH